MLHLTISLLIPTADPVKSQADFNIVATPSAIGPGPIHTPRLTFKAVIGRKFTRYRQSPKDQASETHGQTPSSPNMALPAILHKIHNTVTPKARLLRYVLALTHRRVSQLAARPVKSAKTPFLPFVFRIKRFNTPQINKSLANMPFVSFVTGPHHTPHRSPPPFYPKVICDVIFPPHHLSVHCKPSYLFAEWGNFRNTKVGNGIALFPRPLRFRCGCESSLVRCAGCFVTCGVDCEDRGGWLLWHGSWDKGRGRL